MRVVYNKLDRETVPIFNWCNDMEDVTMEQMINLARLPFVYHHVAAMPDAHLGYGMPIGGVIATINVLIPYAVGSDGGCGMRAFRTSLTEISEDEIKELIGKIREVIPVGKGKNHEEPQSLIDMPTKLLSKTSMNNLANSDMPIANKGFELARRQIGTLGAGNHFIEIQKGSDEHIWIMIHSGSRKLGYDICKHYDKVAKGLNERWHSKVDPKWDLAFLPIGSKECRMFIDEMKYAADYAKANRKLMMHRIKEILNGGIVSSFEEKDVFELDVHHNYAQLENHFGKNVWVHRKGATYAGKDCLGIIPGSQGSKSYIVRGLGNPDSFLSCSHGAGRNMSRTKAKKKLNLEEEIKKMNDKGIIHGMRNKDDLDEADSAYKDIEEVMEQQKDLVEIVIELRPLGVVKG